MSTDRSEMEAARLAGLAKRHETREARAVRKQVAEEIADMTLAARHTLCAEEGHQPCSVCWALGEIARRTREIGSRDPA